MPAFIDLTGLSFHSLTVLERSTTNTTDRQSQWWCRCVCGTRCLVRGNHLRTGHTKSCGCWRDEKCAQLFRTHGMTSSPEYVIWQHMKKRCLDPSDPGYSNYGGRGITICDRWIQSFQNFLEDMGARPSPRHSLDRYPDNNGPYEKTNCRYATRAEQARNTRNNHLLTYGGKTQCLMAWTEELHLNKQLLYTRIGRGWSTEKALTTPVEVKYRNKNHRTS
jgi:hypothetical protein